MVSKALEKNLALLDFEDSPASGLLFTDRIKEYKDDPNVFFDEILTLHRAKDLDATAVYFRRMEGRSSVPQLFVYDNSDHMLSDDDFVDIHRKIWSSGIVPLYYVFDQTEVKIFNSRKPIKKSGRNPLPDAIDNLFLTTLVHDEYKLKKYSAFQFRNGSFWELEGNRDQFKADSSSSKKFIDGLRKIRTEFSKGQNGTACNKLLVLSILVKYLEERQDSQGKCVLQKQQFQQFGNANTFCEVLRKDKVLELFTYLGQNINGKIFTLTKQEKDDISKLNQSKLADFLDAKKEGHQFLFWRQYDFNYLPVELISRIYEEFIPKRKDVAYTPPHLVDFMIDECMPVDAPKDNYKVIDVSCGSGIFLVAAFKRMVQWWQIRKYNETGEIKTPTIRTLKSILRNYIYGVDIEKEAVRLAIFSLTIALCETLDPTKMWDELTQEKLPDLSDNIIVSDFFDFVSTRKKFDLVIGNPPFNLPFDDDERDERDEYWKQINQKINVEYEIPDKSFALLFLQQSIKLLNRDGLLSLVMPSGPLLYSYNSVDFRKNFLENYDIPQIFDFSRLKIFETKNYPISVVFANNALTDERNILHVVVQRTITSQEKLYFELDKYDLHYVSNELAKSERLIWKTNYLGGGHLYHLLKRIEGFRTIEQYLKDRKKENEEWCFGEGYIVGNGDKDAPHLTNKRLIPTEKFNDDLINEDDIVVEHNKKFYRVAERNKDIFKSPHILIKKRPQLPVAFSEGYLIFKDEIIGIHAPEGQEHILLKLREDIISNRMLYKMLLMSGSGRAGVSRSVSSFLKKDVMALPYPDNPKKLRLSKAEQVVCNDVLDYYIDQLREGETAKINTENVKSRDLISFGKTFCVSLNTIYTEDNKEFYSLSPIEATAYICYPFAYGNPNKPQVIPPAKVKKIADGNLDFLIDNQQGRNILFKRIIKLYNRKDMVYLIKPKTLRYWLKSIALRDANEVFTDLVSSGY